MLVVNLAIAEPPALRLPSVSQRAEQVILNGRLYKKRVEVQLPSGFTVDEMPAPYTLESPFARFKLAYVQEKGKLILEEELRTETATLPASDYPAIKKFFDTIVGADSQSAVLVKH
jgi:hypothetical protein